MLNVYPVKSTPTFSQLPAFYSRFKDLLFLNVSCKIFQTLKHTDEMLSLPWDTEFTSGMVNWEWCLRLWWSQLTFICSKSTIETLEIGVNDVVLVFFTPFSSVSIVEFEHVNVNWDVDFFVRIAYSWLAEIGLCVPNPFQ